MGGVKVSEQLLDLGVKSVSLEATVIRADGTREPLGEIARWDKSRVRRALNKVKRKR